jgi:hypothetical protein
VAFYDVAIARAVRLEGVDAPPDCPVCEAFADGLEQLALSGEAWWQRGRLIIAFRHRHHVDGVVLGGIRSWALVKGLQQGGWPTQDLHRIAELVYESGMD